MALVYQPVPIVGEHETDTGSVRSYVIGFVVSLALSLFAYASVRNHWFAKKWYAILFIALLAIVQFSVQLVYFLHVAKGKSPRWKLLVFVLMLIVVVIVVGGSLWIIHNLNTHVQLTPEQMKQYVNSQDGL